MRQRALVWFAVVAAALVVVAAPASAATASVNTTDQDFQAGSLTNMQVDGTGQSASVVASGIEPATADLGAVDDTESRSYDAGLEFTVAAETDRISYSLANPGEFVAVELRYAANNSVIQSVSPGQSLTATVTPGTTYRLVADPGGSVATQNKYAVSFPISSGGVTVQRGYADGQTDSINAWNFGAVTVGAQTIRYVGDTHEATAATVFANLSTVANASVTVTAQADSGSGFSDVASTAVTSAQDVTLDISGSSADRYRIVVDVSPTDTYDVALAAEGVSFSASSPTLSNPDPADGSSLDSYDGDISIDVADADFQLPQGDSVTVTAANQNGQVGSTTVVQNGTATISYSALAGANNITWTATDSYGNTATATQNFTAPATLNVYNESAPKQLVDDATVTLRFYREGEVEVINRTTSNGKVSLGGLPADQAFFVTAEANNYVRRTIYVPSLIEEQSIYLLPDNTESVAVIFDHADYSGNFPQDETVLIVQRELNGSFKTVQGDVFGATGRYSTELERDARHRLLVRNINTGQTKLLGPYTPFASDTESVKIVTNGTIAINRPPLVTVSPGARTLPATATPGLGVELDNQSATIDTWGVTVAFENNTTTQTLDSETIMTGAGTYTPDINLTGYSDGVVNVTVTWSTVAGESGREVVEFAITEYYANDHSLLAVLGAVEGRLPSQTASMFTSLVASFVAIIAGAITASELRAGTEATGAVVVTTLAGFAVMGWVGYGPVFIGGAALAGLIGLRRGL